ncbi:12004_t:CDS:10 [Acaulospora colombiana]|uniref:12004_t:CDS:1 n=1 Tax=Acaulospora colombiana TaxID=27376 RepID=A0ACA9LQZ3_9GLOM|nr:12004_t:CDS:10 [Acaulospora colombiana]
MTTTLANAATYPLDLVVTRIQLSQHNRAYPGDVQTAKNIINKTLRKEGITGLYSGLESDSVATMMSKTSLLKRKSARSGVLDEKAKLTAMLSIPEELLIGLVSGIGSKVVTTPLSVITVHLQHEDDADPADLEKQSLETSDVDAKESRIRRVVKRIYSESGLAGFWRGMSTTVILCANPALTMLFIQLYRRLFLHGRARERPSALQGFIGGALSNTLAVTLLYPLILAKTRLQSRSSSKSKSGLASVLFDIVDRHGVAALYQGLLAQVLKGKKIGNYDILQELIEAEDEDYPGDIFLRWASEYGPTFDMNILWASQIVTVLLQRLKSQKSSTTCLKAFGVMESSLRTHMNKMLDVLNRAHLEGKSLDLQDLFARYTLDTATEFLFGVSTECLEGILEDDPDAPYNQFMNAFSEVAEIGAKRIRMYAIYRKHLDGLLIPFMSSGSTWPLFELSGDKTVAPTKVIDTFMKPTVERALRQAKASHVNSSEYTLLEHLALISNVRDEALNILFAARDTTSSLLTFTGYILMEHPDVAEKMRAEILEICPSGRLPNVADIKKMKYTEAILNETLRLFPPVPYNIRRSTEACPLPSPLSKMGQPLYMPAKSSITYIPILLQRDPELWGEDAAEFKPERWLSGSTPTNAFIPFNAGPRIVSEIEPGLSEQTPHSFIKCLGQQLAYIQISYVWARLLMSDNIFVRADKAICQCGATR